MRSRSHSAFVHPCEGPVTGHDFSRAAKSLIQKVWTLAPAKASALTPVLLLAPFFLTPAAAPAQTYTQALPNYHYVFPRDDFNHPDYQTEWWYYTGNLTSSDGHRFGYELTFFRQGISRQPATTPWFVRDIWMAHLALSDITGQRFYHDERLNRSGPGIAGINPPLIWNGNWQAQISATDQQLRAVSSAFSLALTLTPRKPPVIHGQNGISRKSETGNASHYFSLTRLATTGSLQLDGKTFQVEGSSWMDHEFFTGGLASNQSGWDWLSIQLNDGSDLMLYRLRRTDGTVDPASSGTLVDPAGHTQFLSSADFTMTPATDPAATWTSPTTRARYPIRWQVSIPRQHLQLEITTPLREQELTTRFGPTYWEGAIDATGTRNTTSIKGVGYLELTGYANPGQSVLPH